ncbi:hypothetical protein ACFXGE_44160, partial [Streptomyces sp. NPDC059378]
TVDPDTGQVIAAANSASGGSGGASGDDTVSLAQPITVAAEHGWTGTQTLMLLAALLVFALVLLPSVVSRLITAGRDGGARTTASDSSGTDGSTR